VEPRPIGPTALDRDLRKMDVGQLLWEMHALRQQIRKHRDAKGNDRCWENDVELYKLLPEPLPEELSPEMPESCVFLKNCAAYMAAQNSSTEVWLSVEYDISLTKYIQTYISYNRLDGASADAMELDLRTAFHLLTLPQKLFVAKLGLYCEEAGALPKD
jgi:hypothetical protein